MGIEFNELRSKVNLDFALNNQTLGVILHHLNEIELALVKLKDFGYKLGLEVLPEPLAEEWPKWAYHAHDAKLDHISQSPEAFANLEGFTSTPRQPVSNSNAPTLAQIELPFSPPPTVSLPFELPKLEAQIAPDAGGIANQIGNNDIQVPDAEEHQKPEAVNVS